MAGIQLPQEIINAIAQGEVEALLAGLTDPDLRSNPAFLAKVRQFFRDNEFVTTAEIEGVKTIVQEAETIPDLVLVK